MGTIFNTKIFKGVSINGQEVKGLAKDGVTFYKKQDLPPNPILDLPFNGNFIDQSASGIPMVAGGGLPTFTTGKNGTDLCATFNGSQSIKTSVNLPINSNQVSISLFLSTSQVTESLICETSINSGNNNAFGVFINNGNIANRLDLFQRGTGNNLSRTSLTHNNTWKHIVLLIDRSKTGSAQGKIIIEGVEMPVTQPIGSTTNVGNFVNNILFIGQRNGSSSSFVGKIQQLKVYNYILNSEQIIALKNEPPPTEVTLKKVALIGDSTIAAYSCRSQTIAQTLFTPTEITDGWQAVNLAVPGHTINQQLAVWNADSNKSTYDIIIVQIGLNDMNTATATTLTNYQNLINQINATKKAGAKVYISCMLPCKQRFVDLGMATGQSNWVALNNAIIDNTFTGVDKRNNYHVSLLDDGNGNLAAAYNCGDHIHENQAGADIIITGFRNMIF